MGKPPNNSFVHRVWNHYFHHPFWGENPPIFGNIHFNFQLNFFSSRGRKHFDATPKKLCIKEGTIHGYPRMCTRSYAETVDLVYDVELLLLLIFDQSSVFEIFTGFCLCWILPRLLHTHKGTKESRSSTGGQRLNLAI